MQFIGLGALRLYILPYLATYISLHATSFLTALTITVGAGIGVGMGGGGVRTKKERIVSLDSKIALTLRGVCINFCDAVSVLSIFKSGILIKIYRHQCLIESGPLLTFFGSGTTKGTGGDIIILEEAAYVDQGFFYETVAPLLLVGVTSLICISTLTSDIK
jgi:hypothetical protein